MHGWRGRCKAKQGRREDDADVWILTFTVVRFLGRVKAETEREEIILLTGAGSRTQHTERFLHCVLIDA
jgi:hypothetical protein